MREERIEESLLSLLKQIRFSDIENEYFRQVIAEKYKTAKTDTVAQLQALKLKQEQIKQRLSKLTDAYLDGVVNQNDYIEKKNQLLFDEKELNEKIQHAQRDECAVISDLERFLELANDAYLSYESGLLAEKREMLEIVTSNRIVRNKTVLFKLNYPFQEIVDRQKARDGSPSRAVPRTLSLLVEKLIRWLRENPISKRPETSEDMT